jgi:vitamin B12 transporter
MNGRRPSASPVPRRLAFWAGLCAAGHGALAVRATAQVPSDTAKLSDLVVTATRIPTPPSAIPAGTTVIRGDDLRDRGVHFVLDALREVPGMAVVQTGSYGAVTSVFLRGGESDDVKVLLDGVPLNLPGGSVNFANLTTEDLDRIEIVRGPASVLYGADAMSGVVQLFTRRAEGRGHVDFTGGGGTFGTSDLSSHVDLAGRTWSMSATGSRFGSDGTYAFNDGYRNTVGSLLLGLDAGTHGEMALTVRYGDAVAHFPTDGAGNPVDRNQFTTERSLAAGLAASRSVGNATALHMQLFASRLDQGYTNRADSPVDTTGFDYIDDRSGITWRRGADVRLDRRLPAATLLSVGAGLEHETDAEHDVGVSNFGFGVSHDTAAFAANRTTRDAYLQLLSTPARSISVQLGARVDDNSAFGTFGTWRVGATWHLAAIARVWAAAGTAFKAPTFSQLFAQSAFEVGNPALAPERTRNGDVGAEAAFADRRIRVGATIFWQQFRDLIQYVGAAPGQPTYVNLGGAKSRGLEATLTAAASARVTLSAHWTWLHTAVTDTGAASSLSFQLGSSLIRRPAAAGGGTVAYRWHGLMVAATALRTGARDDVDFSGATARRVTLLGYTTIDLALDAPIRPAGGRSPGVDLTLRGENLFNAAYQQTVGFPGRGRTLLAGGRLRF